MSFSRHIENCDRHDPAGFIPFRVAGRSAGRVRPALASTLADWDAAFRLIGNALEMDPTITDFAERSAAFDRVGPKLVAAGAIRKPRGERYAVLERWGTPPLASIDRGMVTPFGVRAFGLHVNGFTRSASGAISLWVARRARDRAVEPGKLDNMVAGGQPFGLTVAENLLKESWEEAGLRPEIASRAVPVGAVSYTMESPHGLKPDTMFLYDLELSVDITPRNTDGEVESFELWPMERVADSVRDTNDWKFNVNLTMIDFLVRHGYFEPDDPEYAILAAGSRYRQTR